MSCERNKSKIAFAAALAAAILVLLTPVSVSCVNAQAAQAAPSDTPSGGSATVDPGVTGTTPPKKSLTAKAIDKVKEVAKTAGDILSRVPCRSPKGGARTMGSLPHVAAKLVAGKPVVSIAFGSSSPQG